MLATPMAVVMTAPGQNRIRLIVCLVTAHPGGSSFLERASVFATLRRDKESNDDTPALRATPLARGEFYFVSVAGGGNGPRPTPG